MGRKQQAKRERRRPPSTTDQDASRRHAAHGAAALAKRHNQQAFAAYAEAHRLDPTSPVALAGLARAHSAVHDHAAATRCLDELAQLQPPNAAGHRLVAVTWEELGRHAAAARHYRLAASLHPDSCAAQVALARSMERIHQLDDARVAAAHALELDRNEPTANLVQAQLDRRAGDLEAAAARLELLRRRDDQPTQVRIAAGYEAAQVADARGEYDAAMRALLAAKELQLDAAQEPLLQAHKLENSTRLVFASLTSVHLDRWLATEAEPHARRLIALAGHPRSGTTLLEQILDVHDAVAAIDESTVMADVVADALLTGQPPGTSVLDAIDAAAPEQLAARRAAYWSASQGLLGELLGERWLLDKNPELIRLLPFLIRAFPEAKLLIALRDPRDVCISCFMQHLPLNQVSVNWLSLERSVARYAFLMGCWRSTRDMLRPASWLEVRYEDTVGDLEGQARRLLDFLDLPWQPDLLEFHDHARTRPLASPSYEAVTRPVHGGAVGRWQNYAPWLEPHLAKLDPLLRAFGYA